MIGTALGYNSSIDKTEVILPDESRIKVEGHYEYGMEVVVPQNKTVEVEETEENEYVEPYIPYWNRD